MIGADLVVETLRAHGVSFLSTLCGNGTSPLLRSARRAGLRVVDTRNEQTASYMAEAYGRLTRRVGVCAVSSGIGHTNALTGTVDARFDGAPMLLLSGASDHALTDRGKFGDLDQVALAAPVCKYARLVDHPEKIPFYLMEALAHATAGRPGPVHLTIPQDVLEADVGTIPANLGGVADCGVVQQHCAGSTKQVEDAAAAIARARRPILVAGSGVFYARGEEALASFAAQTDMPIVVPIWDRGSIPSRMPQFLGMVGAASGNPSLLQDADLILLAGARVDYRLGYLQPPTVRENAWIIRIDVDPAELRQGTVPNIAIQGDPRSVLEQLCLLLAATTPRYTEWLQEARRRDVEFRSRWLAGASRADRPTTGLHVVEALRPFVQEDALFVVDGGNIGQWMHQVLCDRYPGHWLTCGASGVVGHGLGSAMAARIAQPSRPVILLSGDGSIGFNLADLESASRQRLPFVAVVADDRMWGVIASNQRRRYPGEAPVACELGGIRFDLAAEALGAIGVRVDDPEEIGPAIEQGLASDRPMVIHVPIAHQGPAD